MEWVVNILFLVGILGVFGVGFLCGRESSGSTERMYAEYRRGHVDGRHFGRMKLLQELQANKSIGDTLDRLSSAEAVIASSIKNLTVAGVEHITDASHVSSGICTLAAMLDKAKRERDGKCDLIDRLQTENSRLSSEIADHQDAIQRMREIGKAIGCDHVGGPDERRQIVNCVEQTVRELEQRAEAAEAAEMEMREAVITGAYGSSYGQVRRCSHCQRPEGQYHKDGCWVGDVLAIAADLGRASAIMSRKTSQRIARLCAQERQSP